MREKTISKKTVYTGRILGLEVQEIEMENGKKGLREIVRHRGAVAVLARLPDGRFVLVRQFRKPVEKEMLEVVAGNREPTRIPNSAHGASSGRKRASGESRPAAGLHLSFARLRGRENRTILCRGRRRIRANRAGRGRARGSRPADPRRNRRENQPGRDPRFQDAGHMADVREEGGGNDRPRGRLPP